MSRTQFLLVRDDWEVHVDLPGSRSAKDLEHAFAPHFAVAPSTSAPRPRIEVHVGGPRPLEGWDIWQTSEWTVATKAPDQVWMADAPDRIVARLVRELHRATVWAAGDALQLHGASVALDGRGALLIVGHRTSGKTTTTLALLSRGMSFVANDDALVRFAGDAAYVLGSARRINVRTGTTSNLPTEWPELEDVLLTAPMADGRRDASTIDASSLRDIGVDILPECELRGIIFPALSGEPLTWSSVESGGERQRSLIEHVWSPPSTLNAFLVPFVGRATLTDTLRMAKQLAMIPAYALSGDLSAPGAAARLDSLIDEALPRRSAIAS